MQHAAGYRSFRDQTLHYFVQRAHEGAPDGPLDSDPAAWRGADLRGREDAWTVTLARDELAELEAAMDRVEDRGLGMETVTAADVPLPRLAGRIAEWRREIESGRGFVLVRGLPVDRWGEARAALAFWAIGHHLGVPGAQNPDQELLGHVTDYGEAADQPYQRRYRTSGDIRFHCDAADAVGLLCLRTAADGGESRIASSVTLFNEVARRRPVLVPRLFEPFKLDRRGEHRPGEPPYSEIAPCRFAEGRLRTFYHSDYFRSVTRHPEAGELDPAAAELIELYDALAASSEIHLEMWLEPGDVQLVSNHTIVHARTAYRDAPERGRMRHLLRLWLSFE